MKKSSSINMLEGTLWDRMIIFALPLAFTGVLQQLFNAADVAVLGRFVSDTAVAAVGNNIPLIGLIISFCMGLALGANVVVARALGMRDNERAAAAVRSAFAAAVVFGVAALIVGELLAEPAMGWLEVPAEVRDDSLDYLRVFLLGMPFLAIYNFLAAVCRSQGDTKTPLWVLLAASLFNIGGNLAAVLVFDMGIKGVALATVLANLLAAATLFVRLTQFEGPLRIVPKTLLSVDAAALKMMVRIGWPAGLQGAVFSLSNLIIQSAINSLGAEAMAGSVAAFTIEINVYCFINAFGLATTTFVSQNYGAGNLARCKRATWVSMGLNFVASLVLLGLVLTTGETLLGFFSSNPEVIAIGMIRIFWVVLLEPVNVVMETLSGAMRGYGYSLPPAMVTLVFICTTRITWVYTLFQSSHTFETLMICYPVSWAITTAGLFVLYLRHQKRLPYQRAI